MARPFSAPEREFIVMISPVARAGDVAAALGRRCDSGIRRTAGYSARGDQQPMSPDAVREALRRLQAGAVNLTNLLLWSQESGPRFANQRRLWTAGDDETLRELVGRESVEHIARRLRRTRAAVKARLWQLGIRHKIHEHRCSHVARRLHIRRFTVNDYCRRGLLRSWIEGRWRIVHADDAEWLLENYRYRETDWESLRNEKEVA